MITIFTFFSARQHMHICYSTLYAIARPSVCHTGGSDKNGWSYDRATSTTG